MAVTIDTSNRIKRAVWYTKIERFVASKSIPPIVSFNKAGNEISDPTAPFTGGQTVAGKPVTDFSASVNVNKLLVPCVLLNTETSSNWIGDDENGWMAGFTVMKNITQESSQIYTSAMRPGPGETKWYMGGSNLLPSINVATDQFFCLKGPTHWRNMVLRGVFRVSPIPENFGNYHKEGLVNVPGTNWSAPVFLSSNQYQSGNPYANFVSICLGDWGSGVQKAPRFCLVFRLPSWEPILYASYGPETAPNIGTESHPAKNPVLQEWSEVPRANDPRESYTFDSNSAQEINFTCYVEGGHFYAAIQPWGTTPKSARFVWKLDGAEGREDVAYEYGVETGRYQTDLETQGKQDKDKLNTQMPEGRILVFGNGAPMQFCFGSEFESYDDGQNERELVTNHITSWSALQRMASDNFPTTNNFTGTSATDVEEAIKNMLSAGTCVVSHHPVHETNLPYYQNPVVKSVSVNVQAPRGGGNSDDCLVKTTVTMSAGFAQAPYGGPKTKVFPKIRYIRYCADPYKNLDTSAPEETTLTYLQNGLDFSVEVGSEGESTGTIQFDSSETGGAVPTLENDPRTGYWQDLDGRITIEELRGYPVKVIAGYAFVDSDGIERYKMWPVSRSYIDKATFSMSAGSKHGQETIVNRLAEVGRHALLQKAKGFSIPALDGYSHFYAIKLLANYAGISDSEMAPWRVGVYGPNGPQGAGAAGQAAYTMASHRPSLALVTRQFSPQDNDVLSSWDSPCPGQIENVGGEKGSWRFELSPGGSIYELMQKIAKTFGFLLFFDQLGYLHYEPDLFPLMAGGIIKYSNASSILEYMAKGEFLTEDHFSYDNSIITLNATNVMLGRHDGVMVMGEALYPTCSCGRVNCRHVGRTVNGVYHYVKWGGSLPWNSTRKIPAFRYVYSNSPQQARNPMLRKTWLYVSSPTLTTPAMVNSYAAYLQNWCAQWWVGDTYDISMVGQPHIWAGDFISIKFPTTSGYTRRYFYVRSARHACSSGRFDTTVTGMLLPTQDTANARAANANGLYTSPFVVLPSPPEDASELGWSGRKPSVTGGDLSLEDWF
jgi:hypothetical protein